MKLRSVQNGNFEETDGSRIAHSSSSGALDKEGPMIRNDNSEISETYEDELRDAHFLLGICGGDSDSQSDFPHSLQHGDRTSWSGSDGSTVLLLMNLNKEMLLNLTTGKSLSTRLADWSVKFSSSILDV